MGKKSKRRKGPRQTSAAQKAKEQARRELYSQMQFVAFPQPGDGFGRGRSYDPDEATPWKHFCANCYAGAVVYSDWDPETDEEFSCVCTPNMECSRCKMVWYCDHDCQEQHYKCHKERCRASTGTKEERKAMKKRALQWERENKIMLDKERERLQYQHDMIRKQRELNEACGEEVGRIPRVKECVSSDDEE